MARSICRVFLITLLTLYVTLACSPPSVGSYGGDDTTVNSIAYLKGLYNGATLLITSDIIVVGFVTANNAYGEFPYSIVIEDESGAIEIMCDFDCVEAGFVVGTTVRVLCNGLYLGSTGGMLSLGGAPSGVYPTTQLEQSDAELHLKICDTEVASLIPLEIKIGELTTEHILRYVVIYNLQFLISEESLTSFCSRDEESGQTQNSTHTLIDEDGEQITLLVSSDVVYADENLPTSTIFVTAIVEYFNAEYRLRIVNRGFWHLSN